MGNFICLASGDLRDSVSAVQVPSGPSLRLGRMAGSFCLRGCILILSFRRNTYRQFYGAYRNRTIGGSDGLLASSSAIHTYMLVPIGGGLVSIPKYLVAFFRASRLFRPVPPFRTSSRWEISDAVLAGYAPAGRCLFFTDADLSSTSVQSLVRIVVYLKNISKRIPLN